MIVCICGSFQSVFGHNFPFTLHRLECKSGRETERERGKTIWKLKINVDSMKVFQYHKFNDRMTSVNLLHQFHSIGMNGQRNATKKRLKKIKSKTFVNSKPLIAARRTTSFFFIRWPSFNATYLHSYIERKVYVQFGCKTNTEEANEVETKEKIGIIWMCKREWKRNEEGEEQMIKDERNEARDWSKSNEIRTHVVQRPINFSLYNFSNLYFLCYFGFCVFALMGVNIVRASVCYLTFCCRVLF